MIITIARTIILYSFVTLGIRLMGKRQIGDMQPNELVVTLLISEIAAIPLQDTTQPIINGVVAIFILVILEISVSIISMKSRFVRKLMNGRSVVIISNGTIDQKAMKRVRMTVVDLVEMLRGQDVFDISTVDYAVLEINGNLSVLLKSDSQPVTIGNMKIATSKKALPLIVICDGKLVRETLTSLNLKEKDLNKVLNQNHIKIDDIFLMCIDKYKNYSIVKKDN